MRALLCGSASVFAVLLMIAPAESRFRHGPGPAIANLTPFPSCPKGTGLSDFGGTPDDCLNATQNASFQNANFFSTGDGNARQSGQSAYFYNDSTITWNVPCIDNGCSYDTTQLVNDVADISFSASSGTVTNGVLTVSDANLSATGGNISVGQYIATSGAAATTSSPKTVSLTSHTGGVQVWALDQNTTISGTPTISGTRFPQIGCIYRTAMHTASGDTIEYGDDIVNCTTGSDHSTATTINGYDFSLHGGTWLRIAKGDTGDAGAVTVSNSKFFCSVLANNGGIRTEVSTHFDIYITHNEFDGNSPNCFPNTANQTGFGGINLQNVGTASLPHIIDIEWNYFHNQAKDPGAGNGAFTYMTIANNMWDGFNLGASGGACQVANGGTGCDHGAVYANSLSSEMFQYTYKHNTCLYTTAAGIGQGTTCFSFLALAGSYQDAVIDKVEALGNIAVSNCNGGTCTGSNKTNTEALWASNDPVRFGSLTSTSNLMDPTGAVVIYKGGISRNSVTTSGSVSYASPAISVQTVTNMADNWATNSFVHVNSTPFQFNGTIAPDGNNSTGTLTLDSPNASLSNSYGVAGALVPPGMCISAKIDNSHFTVKNFYGTDNAHLTAPHQAMYTAYTVLDPQQVTDPATGTHPTGTGRNTGTYALAICAGAGTGGGFSTWRRFNPSIGTNPASVNDGTDRQLTDGTARYLGGQDWSAGISP